MKIKSIIHGVNIEITQQDPVDLYRILLIKLSPTSKALYLGLAKFGVTVQALNCSL
jgi:hypothetical protein